MDLIRNVVVAVSLFAVAPVSKAESFPPLVGPYSVSLEHYVGSYAVDDLINHEKSRDISYLVIFPSEHGGARLTINDVFPVNGLDVLKIRLGAFDPDGTVVATMKRIYNTYQLNLRASGQPVATGKFPALIFSPGGHNKKEDYLGLAEQVASLGVVVVLVDHHQYEGSRAFYNPETQDFKIYDQAPDPQTTKNHAMVHMRAEDLRYVVRKIPEINRALGLIDEEKIFLAGHSYGGKAAFYATRFATANVAGFINIDGSFHPTTLDEAYQGPVEENLYLLCSGVAAKHDGPELCKENILDPFQKNVNPMIEALPEEVRRAHHFIRQPELRAQLDLFSFRVMTGKAKFAHEDFGNISLFQEMEPTLDKAQTRNQRFSATAIWHFTARWLHDIVTAG